MTAPTKQRENPLDGVTLEQLRVLVAIADTGSFSAAARRLGRVQSAVSQAMAVLEGLLGLKVWDRSERTVQLTPRGRAVVEAARRVLDEAERMQETVRALADGKGERLSLCVDALFPARALVSLAVALKQAFPAVELVVETDTLASVARRVERREQDVGIAGPLGTSAALERVAVGSVLLVPVAARSHRLSQIRGRVPNRVVRTETQIVLSERDAGGSPDQAVLSERTWRVADIATKHELIRGGLGWGNLPATLIEEDVKHGALSELAIESWSPDEHRLPLALVFPPALRRRPIVKWLLGSLPTLCDAWGVGLPGRAGGSSQ